jgi:hypothetical protein
MAKAAVINVVEGKATTVTNLLKRLERRSLVERRRRLARLPVPVTAEEIDLFAPHPAPARERWVLPIQCYYVSEG